MDVGGTRDGVCRCSVSDGKVDGAKGGTVEEEGGGHRAGVRNMPQCPNWGIGS